MNGRPKIGEVGVVRGVVVGKRREVIVSWGGNWHWSPSAKKLQSQLSSRVGEVLTTQVPLLRQGVVAAQVRVVVVGSVVQNVLLIMSLLSFSPSHKTHPIDPTTVLNVVHLNSDEVEEVGQGE